MLEAHILKSFPGEHDPRTQGGPPPSAIMGMVKPLQNLPFLLDRVGISEILIH